MSVQCLNCYLILRSTFDKLCGENSVCQNVVLMPVNTERNEDDCTEGSIRTTESYNFGSLVPGTPRPMIRVTIVSWDKLLLEHDSTIGKDVGWRPLLESIGEKMFRLWPYLM